MSEERAEARTCDSSWLEEVGQAPQGDDIPENRMYVNASNLGYNTISRDEQVLRALFESGRPHGDYRRPCR